MEMRFVRVLGLCGIALGLCGCDKSAEKAPKLSAEKEASPATGSPEEKPEPEKGSPAAAPGASDARGLGWELSDGKSSLYLVGSVHVGTEALYPIPKKLHDAFQKSALLVEELRLDEAMSPESQQLFVSRGMYPPGEQLNQHIPEELAALLKERAAYLGPLAPAHQQMRPWLLGTAMSMQELSKKGFLPEQGLDTHFAKEAAKRELGYEALETVEGQSSALASLPDEVQVLMLKETLEEIETVSQDIEKLLKAWKEGDAKTIEEVMMESFRDPKMQPAYDALFVQRNIEMQKKILNYLKTPAIEFVVVGAGHLVGEHGLVTTLKGSGRTLKQL